MKKNILLIFDFDGVIALNEKEPLVSSYLSLGLNHPNKEEITSYTKAKKHISTIAELHTFIKSKRRLDINLKQFTTKLFEYRKNNLNNDNYIDTFKPTLFLFLLRILKNYFECLVLTSRDKLTIEKFMKKYNLIDINIISSTICQSNKGDIIKEIIKKNKNIIYLDDMKKNFIDLGEKNIIKILIKSRRNYYINLQKRIYQFLLLLLSIIYFKLIDK